MFPFTDGCSGLLDHLGWRGCVAGQIVREPVMDSEAKAISEQGDGDERR